MANAFDGILVVSLEQAVAAPYASSRLADAGARVIKIERPDGDFARSYDRVAKAQSAYFVWLNRGKESLALDIKDAGDAALLHRILEKADVYIQNLSPGAAARSGFGSADLRRKFPRLITCDITGYGEDGPYRDMRGLRSAGTSRKRALQSHGEHLTAPGAWACPSVISRAAWRCTPRFSKPCSTANAPAKAAPSHHPCSMAWPTG